MYEKAKTDPKTFEMIKARERAQYEYNARLTYAERQGAFQKAIENAKNFLKMGLSAEQVAQGTGFSIKDVRALI